MLLTSREQALLTVALDGYLQNALVERMDTENMWAELYDAVICADIDDVGEEYDPFDEGLDWDAEVINSWAADLKEGCNKHDGADDVAHCVSAELAQTLYDSLGNRFHEEFEAEAEEQAAHDADQLDFEDAIKQMGPTTYNTDVETVVRDRFNRFSQKAS